MNKKLLSAGIGHALLLGGTLTLSQPLLAAGSNNPALQALFDQATYWHQKAHDDLAKAALQKVLTVEANNTEALYLLALYAQQSGDNEAAAYWRSRLSQVSPDDSHLAELDNARKMQAVPQSQVTLARQQAKSGNIAAALQTWRNTFSGEEPPANLAAEYYLTMAGDRSLLPQAVDKLRQFAAAHPQDKSAQLALGKVLSYQESTRREGISLLESLAETSKEADSALRQSLLWLAPQSQDAERYQTYLQRHPQDSAVMEYYRKNVGGAERGAGYDALNSGDVAGAEQFFSKVLAANPQDADALAGMGYVAQRSGQFGAAADYLQRAAQQGGEQSETRQQQANDAQFYAQLTRARQALESGNSVQALALSEPLTQAEGEKGVAAKLFRADVLRRDKQFEQAEQTYRAVLQSDADNRNAKEGLFYVLRQQNRTAEANALLGDLPDSVRQSVAPRGSSSSEPLRQQAKRALEQGNSASAITILQQGIQRFPNDGWLRLDLARIYRSQGNNAQAADVMQPVLRSNASVNEVYAGAINASESGAWQQASQLMQRIPVNSQNQAMRTLAQRVNFNLQMATADQYLAQGSTAAAANTLKALAVNPPSNPVDAGNLAKKLAQAGDLNTAVKVVRSNMQRGVQGNAGDYAAQVAVLNQAGLSSEAQNFLNNPVLQARSTPTQLAGIRNGYVINEADRLREQKQYAAAYDKLIGALQHDPQNRDLMFAMARLYQSGKMNKEAGVVYDYLITQDTPGQDAREGAINVALAQNDLDKANTLARGLDNKQQPDRLLLLARVAEANGNHAQAVRYLRTARGQLIGLQGAESGGVPTIGGLALADNPFINRNTPQQQGSPSSYGSVLPWQSVPASSATSILPDSEAAMPTAQSRMLHQITDMMDDLEQKTGTWLQGGVQVRGRDGESGLSKLTEAKAPLTWSSAPFGDARFEFSVTPVTLNAGTASGDAWRRLGSGAGGNAVQNLVNTINNEQRYIEGLNAAERANFAAAHPELVNEDRLKNITFDKLNPLTAQGAENLAWLNNNRAVKDYLLASSRKPSVTQAGSDSSNTQNTSGVELSLALKGSNYKIDLGSTPLGQDLSTLIGGIQWSPKLTDYLTLILTGERRAVTDSLLSYVGTEDKLSGKRWGRVTKNGGNALLSYDNGDAGFYAGAGLYSYQGENVASNDSVQANAGAYVRPFHYDDRELKLGMSLSWMDFSKNLSYFSYGQGGYFSPQNYVSVSLPVDFTRKYDDLDVKLGGSVGYQSYSQDKSAYFPGNPEWQSFLDEMVKSGFAKESYYSGGSKNGIGYNIHAGADYKVSKDMSIGGQLGYDTFGDYNESTAQLWFRYLFGDK